MIASQKTRFVIIPVAVTKHHAAVLHLNLDISYAGRGEATWKLNICYQRMGYRPDSRMNGWNEGMHNSIIRAALRGSDKRNYVYEASFRQRDNVDRDIIDDRKIFCTKEFTTSCRPDGHRHGGLKHLKAKITRVHKQRMQSLRRKRDVNGVHCGRADVDLSRALSENTLCLWYTGARRHLGNVCPYLWG
jgi:hypothetical protein